LDFLSARGLLDGPQLQPLEEMRAQAERLRAVITEERKRRPRSIWRKYIAKVLAGIAVVFALSAALLSLELFIERSIIPDPFQSLEALAEYLRR
jgi:hypothetical protein